MSRVEAAVVGYILGFFVGLLIELVLIGYILVFATRLETPEFVQDVYAWTNTYRYAYESLFLVLFIVGVLSGISGQGKAAYRRR